MATKNTGRGPFVGRVSIVMNTKGAIALQKEDTGKFRVPEDTTKLFAKMNELGEEHDAKVNIFAPNGTGDATAAPVVLQKYGNPYMAFLSPRANNSHNRVVKLA